MNELIRQKFGAGEIDPLAGVSPNRLEEARCTVELWSDASRSDLRMLARAVKKERLPEWKASVLARLFAKRALETTDRRRRAFLIALGSVDPRFDALAIAAYRPGGMSSAAR